MEPESEAAMAEYRRLDFPRLFFCSLHALEVRNAILQRAFHQRRSVASSQRRDIARERDAALGRLERLLSRGTLLDVVVDFEAAINRAVGLSAAHTERSGARAIDLLHVAAALTLESEVFLTIDIGQQQVAKAAGLRVVSVISPRA
jgi:hypothetical protein